jgi:hypothetical protein
LGTGRLIPDVGQTALDHPQVTADAGMVPSDRSEVAVVDRTRWAKQAPRVVAILAVPLFALLFGLRLGTAFGQTWVGSPEGMQASFGPIYMMIGGVVGFVWLSVAGLLGLGRPGTLRRGAQIAVALSVVAFWSGGFAGYQAIVLLDGPVYLRGHLTYGLGEPLNLTVASEAVCTTVYHTPDDIEVIHPTNADFLSVYISRDFPTRATTFHLRGPGARSHSREYSEGGTYLDAYGWKAVRSDDQPTLTGHLTFRGFGDLDTNRQASSLVEVRWDCGTS